MKTGIKILIALLFIIGSFMLGKNLILDEMNIKTKQYENDILLLAKENRKLNDSIQFLENKIDSISIITNQK